jgi:hypothetical protein
LTFGEKSWQIHKALACCHSIWFQKAVNIGFEASGFSQQDLSIHTLAHASDIDQSTALDVSAHSLHQPPVKLDTGVVSRHVSHIIVPPQSAMDLA